MELGGLEEDSEFEWGCELRKWLEEDGWLYMFGEMIASATRNRGALCIWRVYVVFWSTYQMGSDFDVWAARREKCIFFDGLSDLTLAWEEAYEYGYLIGARNFPLEEKADS